MSLRQHLLVNDLDHGAHATADRVLGKSVRHVTERADVCHRTFRDTQVLAGCLSVGEVPHQWLRRACYVNLPTIWQNMALRSFGVRDVVKIDRASIWRNVLAQSWQYGRLVLRPVL